MKRIVSVTLVLLSCLCFLKNHNVEVFADTSNLSKSAYLCDYNSGTVIKAYNENARLPIASMCKIMTLLIVFEEIDCGRIKYDDVITVSANASGMGGSQAFLETNGEYYIKDLIKSIIVASANDSCVALAEYICGSEDDFVEKMNEKAKSIGMRNTLFANCTGLPKPTQYSCAKDVALMFCELIKHNGYFDFSKIWTEEINHPKGRVTGLTNTNKLVRTYDGCDGGKTGYTAEAGHCLTATAKRGGMRLVSVVISSPDSATRFKESAEMFNFGFANFTNKMVVDSTKPLSIKAKVIGGKEKSVEVYPSENYFAFSKKNDKENYRLDYNPLSKIKAPITKGDTIGELVIYKDNQEVARINCLAGENICKKTYFDCIHDIVFNW